MLLAATFFWGWTFPVVKDAIATMPVFAFLAWRFAIAAIVMTAVLRRLPHRQNWQFGTQLGIVLFAVFAFQTWGLLYTSSANSAFITGLNVLWIFLLQRGAFKKSWAQIILVIGGLWLLTPPDETFNIGDLLTLICSGFIAWHIFMLAKKPAAQSSGDLVAVQFATIAIISAALSLATEEKFMPFPITPDIIFALLLTACGATVFSFWAQTHFQRHTTPLRTGLIFICEPVFAALFAWGIYAEKIPPLSWLGATLILIALIWTLFLQEANKK